MLPSLLILASEYLDFTRLKINADRVQRSEAGAAIGLIHTHAGQFFDGFRRVRLPLVRIKYAERVAGFVQIRIDDD